MLFTLKLTLFRWDHDHCDQVDQHSRYAAGDECDEHGKTEPKWTDPKKFAKSAANAGDDAVVS